MIRVLQVFGGLNMGGSETMVMNYFRHIDRTQVVFDFVSHLPNKGFYEDEILSLGGKIFHLERYNGINTINYIKQWKELFKEHPEYSIVHVHNFKVAVFVNYAAKISGVKTRIVHSHSASSGNKNIRNLGFQFLKPLVSLNSTHLFACGSDAGKYLFGKKSFTVMPNAIDVDIFRFNTDVRHKVRNELNLSEDDFAMINVGRLTIQKNQKFLLDVFIRLVSEHPNFKLFIVGKGERKDELNDYVVSNNLQNNVFLLGARNDINLLLQGCDAFLFPSLWEGLPVTLVEAQAAGLQILVSSNITKEVKITDLAQYIALDIDVWCENILKMTNSKKNREEYNLIVQNSSYNIFEQVKILQSFYLNNC